MILQNAPLNYPEAVEWMWNYCIYLGPFTDSEGYKYDLGIFLYNNGLPNSAAIVYGNKPGEYLSGDFWNKEMTEDPKINNHRLLYTEVYNRAKVLNLL